MTGATAQAADGPGADVRLGDLLGSDPAPRVELIGFPTDEGVRRNGGRPGAARGPAAFRRALERLTPDPRRPEHARLLGLVTDSGDVGTFGKLEERQAVLGKAVAQVLRAHRIPVVVGGGHETTFGHFLGYVEAGLDVSILNIDAHPDVRPTVRGRGHSGSPFRQAAEHDSGRLRAYSVFGLQPHAVAAPHLEYLRARGMIGRFRDETDRAVLTEAIDRLESPSLVTIDLDVVDQAQAPGVSAPCTNGLAAGDLLAAVEAAGQNPAVRSLDVVELNPCFDLDDRTARLAAKLVWCFLRGLLDRPSEPQ